MKALVISDSHGAAENLGRLMAQLTEKGPLPEALIFCGDGIWDMQPYRERFSLYLPVRGNCDISWPPDVPPERVERMNGADVLIAHGNAWHVKRGHETLLWRAREVGALAACFGHTHRQTAGWQGSVFLLNPGALSLGYYAILTIEAQGEISAQLMSLQAF